jgi:hypothetical protein
VVLVATGSFNPPTYMHLRMFGKLGCEFFCFWFNLNGYDFREMGFGGEVFNDQRLSTNWVMSKDFSFNLFFANLVVLFVTVSMILDRLE